MPLVEIESPFIVLENCTDHRLYVLPIVEGNPVKIGRGHECNMNIHDTSISRVQASIEFENGAFWVKDRGSRFGTYVKITKSLLLEQGQQFSVQVGRTILQLSMKRSAETGDEAPDTDTTASPRGSGRSVVGASEPQEDFLSCEGGVAE
jgi:predicted component of type VI protein secretion system